MLRTEAGSVPCNEDYTTPFQGGAFENVGRVGLLSQHLGCNRPSSRGALHPSTHRTARDSEGRDAIASLVGDAGGRKSPEVWVLAPTLS